MDANNTLESFKVSEGGVGRRESMPVINKAPQLETINSRNTKTAIANLNKSVDYTTVPSPHTIEANPGRNVIKTRS